MIERLWMMSLQAAVLIGLVSILRLFLAKSPKIYSYVLWLMVLFRLLCPVLLESRFSLWPDLPVLEYWEEEYGRQEELGASAGSLGAKAAFKEWESSRLEGGIEGADNEREGNAAKADGMEMEMEAEAVKRPQEPLFSDGKIRQFLYGLWAVGVLVTSSVFLIQFILLRKRIRTSVRQKGNVWRCERIGTPFVMGVFKPGIYLPFELEGEACEWILQHERMHIRHRDSLFRAAEILALCLHWWNPAVWYAMHKWNQDMEMFCDEAVLAGKDIGLRKEYAKILLDFAMEKGGSLLSLSFGKSNTEKRVRHVLSEKRASLGKTIGVAAVMAVAAVGFLTVPWRADAAQTGATGLEQVKQAQMEIMGSISKTKGEEYGRTDKDIEKLLDGGAADVNAEERMESICGISREQADFFLEKLIHDATLGNQKETADVFRKEIAAVFAYPLRISLEGKDVYIQNEEELLLYYEQIFTGRMLRRMEIWRREVPFYNWQGVSWGDGSIWLQRINDEIKITAIWNE